MEADNIMTQKNPWKDRRWAFRYANQDKEAAYLVAPVGKFRHRTVKRCLEKMTTRPIEMVDLNDAEWTTWEAFKLCPIVEISATKIDGKRVLVCKRITS